jgi:hypothetical protein
MLHWSRRLLIAAAALSLGSCLWGPGRFTSDLTLKRDGSFILDYRGEIVLMLPPDEARVERWADDLAVCHSDGRSEIRGATMDVTLEPPDEGDTQDSETEVRPCTPAEIAKLKAQHEKQQAEHAARKHKENEEMARLFGIPGFDEESSREFAAKLAKYEGWRSVAYRGDGVFDVVYHMEGRATQDFIFPTFPDNELIVPFVALRRRADGSVLVTAPAFSGGLGTRPGAEIAAIAGAGPGKPPPSHADGRFTIVTDGEILTNNSDDGPAAHPLGRQVHWDVSPSAKKVPEALIRLK